MFSVVFIPRISKFSLFLMDQQFTFHYQFIMCFTLTFILLWYLRVMLNSSFPLVNVKHSWIIQHTLHVKGLADYINQEQLKQNIEGYLFRRNLGNLIGVSLIPNYAKILQFELKKKDYEMKLQCANQPRLRQFIIPQYYRTHEFYNQKIEGIRLEQLSIVQKGIYGSGHAFFAVDSDQAYNQILKIYSTERASLSCLKQTCQSVEQPFCGHWQDQDEIINDGTLPPEQGQAEIMEIKNFTNQIKTMLIKPASPKIDILWMNFHLKLQGHLLRKIIINILALVILIFFTSPMAILNLIGLKYIGNVFNGFELQYVIQTLVVGVNNLLLLLIDLGTSWEKPTSKSIYQKSIYTKCVFYLTLNMFLIPSVSFFTVTSLYEIVAKNVNNLFNLLQAIFFFNNGKFFSLLIIQSGTFSFLNYFLRLNELIKGWLSPTYTEYKWRYFKTQDSHLQLPDNQFQYGYFYGLQIAIMYITFTYSTNSPIILLSALFFFLLKHFQDSFSLHWIFREELNSQNDLFHRAITSLGFCIFPLQLICLVIFTYQQQYVYIILMLILIGVTIFALITIYDLKNKYLFTNQQINKGKSINIAYVVFKRNRNRQKRLDAVLYSSCDSVLNYNNYYGQINIKTNNSAHFKTFFKQIANSVWQMCSGSLLYLFLISFLGNILCSLCIKKGIRIIIRGVLIIILDIYPMLEIIMSE